MDQVRIAMWSGPRNISTTMMRSFSSRSDTFVSDEPFYACYLQRTGLQHPGREEILRSCKQDYHSIINDITSPIPAGKNVWYQKHMAHHLEPGDSLDWTQGLMNCLLIRTPAEVISSFSKKNELNDESELGYLQQIQLYRYHNNELPVVDAQDILRDPSGILSNLCSNVVSHLKRECYPGQQVHTPLMAFGANTGTINYGVQLVSNLMYKKR